MILAVDLKITNKHRNGIPPVGIVSAPCNNFLNSIWGSLRICYNNTCVLKLDHYPIYNYTRMLLNCNNFDFDTWATNRIFYKEGSSEDLDDVKTTGWLARRKLFGAPVAKPARVPKPGDPTNTIANPQLGKFRYSENATFFMGTLDHFLPQPPFLPNTDIHVELDLNKPSYVFQSQDETEDNIDINFDLDRCKLYVPEIELNDKLYTQMSERIKKEPLRQFFTSTHINTFSISANSKIEDFDCVAKGLNPSRLYVLLQETDRINGKFTLNSLKFPRLFNKTDPFLLQSVKVTVKGEEVEGLNADTSLHTFRDNYFRLFHLLKHDSGKQACSLSFEDFTNHACILVYDLTASKNATEPPILPLVKPGHLRVTVEFSKASTCPMTLITICEMQSAITIEESGKCTLSTV